VKQCKYIFRLGPGLRATLSTHNACAVRRAANTVLDRAGRARAAGFCGPEYDRLTMRGNRYTMREEADYGIFQYDNMLDFDQDRVDQATTPDNSNGFNPYLYAKYPGNGLAHV